MDKLDEAGEGKEQGQNSSHEESEAKNCSNELVTKLTIKKLLILPFQTPPVLISVLAGSWWKWSIEGGVCFYILPPPSLPPPPPPIPIPPPPLSYSTLPHPTLQRLLAGPKR